MSDAARGAPTRAAAGVPRLVLLPGMDGTGALFARLLGALLPAPAPLVVAYPPDRALDLDGLAGFVAPLLPPDEPYVLVGESFSGLVAVRLAAGRPRGLAGLVLVASFLRYPRAGALAWRALVNDALFRLRPPAALLRALAAGVRAPDLLVADMRAAIASVTPPALASRLRAVLAADVRAELAGGDAPVLYLAGAHDRLVGRWAVDQVRAARPDVTVVTMEAPHLVLQRCPHAAAAALTAFAARCGAIYTVPA